jgi:hypothetical protein
LKGLGIGNGWMSPLEQGKYASYLYYHGLLDSEQFFILRDLEDTLIDMVSHTFFKRPYTFKIYVTLVLFINF